MNLSVNRIVAGCFLALPLAALGQASYPTPYSIGPLAGYSGVSGSADGTGRAARFNSPAGVALDGAGNLYVADSGNNAIRKVVFVLDPTAQSALGVVTTLAGAATNVGSADGIGRAAQFNSPSGVAVDSAGNVYVADSGNNTIRRVTPAGGVTTIAGLPGSAGSADGTGSAAQFHYPFAVAVDGAANIYVADTDNCTIRVVTPGGVVTTLAGRAGVAGSADGTGIAAQFSFPYGIALDSATNLYVADTGNSTIRKITPAGVVTTLAGRAGDIGSADATGSAAAFNYPYAVGVDDAGNIYVADTDNSTLRRVTDLGLVTSLAGLETNAGAIYGTGRAARLDYPYGLAVDGAGNVFVADSLDETIRTGVPAALTVKVPSTVMIQTNGNGAASPNYDGKPLVVGAVYSVTAVPAKNWIFSNWVGGTTSPYTALSTNESYTFAAQSNLVLQANFVTNFFLTAQGAYNGLFAPVGLPRAQTNSGSFTLHITPAGVVSGNLLLGIESIPLSGHFDVSGAVAFYSTRRGQNPLTTLLQLDLPGQSVQGTVSDGSFSAELSGNQDVFTSAHKAVGYEGQYTLIIPGTNDPTVGPLGASYATVTVSSLGAITLVGSLADGTPASQASVVSEDGLWPFYIPLYGGNGSLWGWNYFTNGTIISGANTSWINGTNTSKAALYRVGFTNQSVQFIASPYNPVLHPLLSITSGQVTLSGGNLPFTIANEISMSLNNAITFANAPENPNKLALTVNKSTGVITGSFANPSNPRQTIKVNGVMLQNETNAAGYFLGTNQSGAFLLEPSN